MFPEEQEPRDDQQYVVLIGLRLTLIRAAAVVTCEHATCSSRLILTLTIRPVYRCISSCERLITTTLLMGLSFDKERMALAFDKKKDGHKIPLHSPGRTASIRLYLHHAGHTR